MLNKIAFFQEKQHFLDSFLYIIFVAGVPKDLVKNMMEKHEEKEEKMKQEHQAQIHQKELQVKI